VVLVCSAQPALTGRVYIVCGRITSDALYMRKVARDRGQASRQEERYVRTVTRGFGC
jgi:hypothetical protein